MNKLPDDVVKCTSCRYCLLQETGWSNWTVDGTDAHCLLELNPGFPEDIFYGADPQLLFATQCESFYEGDPVYVDVEMELGELEEYSDDPEIKELLRTY